MCAWAICRRQAIFAYSGQTSSFEESLCFEGAEMTSQCRLGSRSELKSFEGLSKCCRVGRGERGNEDEGVGVGGFTIQPPPQSSGSREVPSGSLKRRHLLFPSNDQYSDKPEGKQVTSGTSLLTLWTPISLRTRSVQVGQSDVSRSRCVGQSRLVPSI
jgi:hypothetical protein